MRRAWALQSLFGSSCQRPASEDHVVGIEAGARAPPRSAFAAHFVEVRIDKDLGLLRIARVVSAIDSGRVLNEKTARSQIIGGVVMGIGMATLEQTIFESATGRIANATFGDYLIPVNADVPDITSFSASLTRSAR